MAKCRKCDAFYHPDYMVVVDEALNAQNCVFCYLDKNAITIEDETTGEVDRIVTRQNAQELYKQYLHRLTQDPKIKEMMMKGDDSGLILDSSGTNLILPPGYQ